MKDFLTELTDKGTADILRSSNPASPQESAQIIRRADRVGMHPDNYNDMKDTLDPELNLSERIPAQVGQPVKDFASKSSSHAKLVENETGVLNTIYNQGRHIFYNLFEKQKIEGDKLDLIHKKRTSDGVLPQHEQDMLDYLDQQEEEKLASFQLEGFEQVPGQAAGVVNDMFQAITNNKLLIGGAAAAGFFTPVPFTGPAALGLGVTAALAKDAYFRIAELTYHDMSKMKDDQGRPLNLSHDTKDNIAMSVGAISGLLEAVTGKVLTGGLGKLARKKVLDSVVKNTGMKAAMDVLGHTMKSAAVSGGEETTAEIAAIVGENFARGVQSEAGLQNAIIKTYEDIRDDAEVRKRLGMTATVGAVAGAGIAGTTGSLTGRRIKKQYDDFNMSLEEVERQQVQTRTIRNAIQSLENQDSVVELAKLTLSSEMKNLSPEQMTEFRKEVFREAGYKDKVWFSDTDIEVIAQENPEIAQKIRAMDTTQASKSDTSSLAGVEVHEFMDLVEEAPTVSEHARLTPEAPNPLESRRVLELYKEAELKRQEIFESLGKGEEFSPEQIEILKGLDDDIEKTFVDAGEEGYVSQTKVFTEAMESVIPEKTIESYKKDQLEARQAVADQVNQELNAKEGRAEERLVKGKEKIEEQVQYEKLKKDIAITEKFKRKAGSEATPGHKKKGHSPLAIDPASLPDNLREAYVTDKKLINRKVFVEGGITLEESAALAGVKDGETLLKTLANTPTRKEMLAERRQKSAQFRKEVKETRGKTLEERRNKIFDDQNMLHKKDMEYMKNHKWPATKRGIRLIVLPLPKMAELNNTARKAIAKTRVGELNPRQFNASEKSLNRKAASFILKNKVEEAFMAKGKAMLNVELTRESLRTKQQIDTAKTFLKKITSKEGLETFKKAGLYPQAKTILDLFNMNPSRQQGTKQDSYFEYIERLDQQGKSVIVPESLADVRQRGTDLTTEEYLRVYDRLKTLHQQSKHKNKIIKRVDKITKMEEIRTEEAIVSIAEEDLRLNHPSYDKRRLKKVRNENSITMIDKMKERYGIVTAAIGNMKNILTELDQEALGGQHYENIAQPMVEAETAKRAKLSQVINHIKKITDTYGSKNFSKAFNDFIDIKEFEGYGDLGNGKMTRSDLWTLLMYTGDPQGIERIGNFINDDTKVPMTIETVRRVLDQHLTEADAKVAQNFANIFKSFEAEAATLHERTTGVAPSMVKGVPITHKGKVYEGGYVPNNYLDTSHEEKLTRFLDVLGDRESSMFGGGKKDGKLYGRLRSAEMTDQGRMIDRKGSTKALDTDFMNILHAYEEHIHDVTYREAGVDTLKLLRNQAYKNSIIATVGVEKYNTLGNAIIETVGGSANEDALNPFSREKKWADGVVNGLSRNFAVATLGFKLTSVLMQPLSFGAAVLRMGPKGGRYILNSFGRIIKNPLNYSKMFNDAALINPDIQFGKDSVDDSMVKSYFEELPTTRRTKYAQGLATLDKAKQSFVDASMIGLKKLDLHIKVATTIASYSQFLDGNVKDFPTSRLDKMGDAEKISRAKKYAKQIADLALTTSATIDKSAVEKISQLRMFTMFYTDLRSQLNSSFSQIRKIKNSRKRVIADLKDGNVEAAVGNFKGGAVDFAALFAVHTMTQMYTSILYDQETPLDEDDFGDFVGSSLAFIASAPVKGILGSTLLSRDITFAMTGSGRKKDVSFPLNRVFSDFAMTASGLLDLLQGEELDSKQIKSTFYATSVATGVPLMEVGKFLDNVSESEVSEYAAGYVKGLTQKLGREINKYIKKNKDNPSKEETIKELQQIQKDFLPTEAEAIRNIMPETYLETMKTSDWKDIDPDTGAAGVYQFTEERWREIGNLNPTLGLTEAGRVSKDVKEQEKAMAWSSEANAKGLIEFDVPVNINTLYGAHKFGLENYIEIYNAEGKTKLKTFLGEEADQPVFKKYETVNSVKSFISKEMKEAEEIDKNQL